MSDHNPQGFKAGDSILIRSSVYELTEVPAGWRSAKGRMTSGKGKVGMVYKIHPSLLTNAVRVAGTPGAQFVPSAAYSAASRGATATRNERRQAQSADALMRIAEIDPEEMADYTNAVMAALGCSLEHGDTFKWGPHEFTLRGYKRARPQMPVAAYDKNGRRVKLPLTALDAYITK